MDWRLDCAVRQSPDTRELSKATQLFLFRRLEVLYVIGTRQWGTRMNKSGESQSLIADLLASGSVVEF